MATDIPAGAATGAPQLSEPVPARVRDVAHAPSLYNHDLAPTADKTWGVFSFVALWMSAIHNLAGYSMVAALFIVSGLGLWQVAVSLALASVVLTVGMNVTGAMGEKTGVPFPVLARISFGTRGAQLPALVRAVVGIMWYGIQTYLASQAIVIVLLRLWPSLASLNDGSGFLGLPLLGWLAFLAMWAAQLVILSYGMDVIRRFQVFAGPAIWVVMLILAVWLVIKAGGDLSATPPNAKTGWPMWQEILAGASLAVAFWGTLLLNFSDFSRFAKDRETMVKGNRWGLPLNNIAFAVVAAVATAGALAVYGKAITDPGALALATDNTTVIVLVTLVLLVATMGVNVIANFVSPAYDLANVVPSKLDFRRGGLVAAVLALAVLPWKIYGNPDIVQYFLGGLGAFLGPLFGVIAVDYWLVRRGKVDVAALFDASAGSAYHFWHGVNPRALVAFVPSAVLGAVVALVDDLSDLAAYSWPIGTVVGGLLYFLVADRATVYEDVPAEHLRVSGAGGDLR
jgi:NCS1 family nucleobase:cation symporter-1